MCDEVIDRLFILLFIKIKIDRHVMNGNIKILTHARTKSKISAARDCSILYLSVLAILPPLNHSAISFEMHSDWN